MNLIGKFNGETKKGQKLTLKWNKTETICESVGYIPNWIPDGWLSNEKRPKVQIFEYKGIQKRYTELQTYFNLCGGVLKINGPLLMKVAGNDTDWTRM